MNIIERVSSFTIGTVESVSPSQIKVLLELDAPQATALNTGYPTRFPRINGYVLIPNEAGAVVGLIDWLGVERSSFPKRTGLKDFGLIDLPYPLRKLSLTLVGTLKSKKNGPEYEYFLERGVSSFPSVGDPVLLPTNEQLRSIIEAKGKNRRVKLGTSPLADNTMVTVDPDKMFGRHLAVLGNTGSGKSCTLAGLIRWSLETANAERADNNIPGPANARFIILDPNGEYLETFNDLPNGTRVFKVMVDDELDSDEGSVIKALTLPAWMWNSSEWAAFSSASPGTQRPILLQGLRDLRAGAEHLSIPIELKLVRQLKFYRARILNIISTGEFGNGRHPQRMTCGNLLKNIAKDANAFASLEVNSSLPPLLLQLSSVSEKIALERAWRGSYEGFNDFSYADFQNVLQELDKVLLNIEELLPEGEATLINEDSPVPFLLEDLPDHLESLSQSSEGATSQFIAYLTMRIRNMLSDKRLGPILNPTEMQNFSEWLDDYIGANDAQNGQIAILDLSLVPTEIIHMVIAVIGRVVFEATQRYKKVTNDVLPTILVLEEAHTFIHKNFLDGSGSSNSAQLCRHTFERIAREGRKFGLGLVISSQRPSELSPTVLSQCNTFILHRIVNDKDQELVSRLVPDNLGGLLSELPSLPARQAILLGWAVPVPILVEISELPITHCPRSEDPEFWNVWTGKKERAINWQDIVSSWEAL